MSKPLCGVNVIHCGRQVPYVLPCAVGFLFVTDQLASLA